MDPKAFRRFATPLLIAFAAGGWVWAFTLKAGNAHARTDAGNDGAGGPDRYTQVRIAAGMSMEFQGQGPIPYQPGPQAQVVSVPK